MTPDEQKIYDAAMAFARENKNRLGKLLTDKSKYPPDQKPVSVFMAGSPGAGKTEYSRSLIDISEENESHDVLRIDSDEIRKHIPGYIGTNSNLFQGAVSIIVDRMHDLALHNKQSFVFDGTFSNYERAKKNVVRSLEKRRLVVIFYVYQKPEVAWQFTLAREKEEGRNIPKSALIEQYFGALDTVMRLRKEYNNQEVMIYLVKKNFQNPAVHEVIATKQGGETIDHYLPKDYNKNYLEQIL